MENYSRIGDGKTNPFYLAVVDPQQSALKLTLSWRCHETVTARLLRSPDRTQGYAASDAWLPCASKAREEHGSRGTKNARLQGGIQQTVWWGVMIGGLNRT